MAVRGPYQLTLTTTPQPIDLMGMDNRDGTRFAWICYDTDWFAGGEDVNPTTLPGGLVKAGRTLEDSLSGSDRWYGYVSTGTATLHRFPGGV